MTYRPEAAFPPGLRDAIEHVCGGKEIAYAGEEREGSGRARARDAFVQAQLAKRGYSSERNVRVADGSRFDIDLLVEQPDWRAAISIQGGQAARIDLDLLKFIAFGRAKRDSKPVYAVLIASDKFLLRTITGTPDERAFDYARRLRPLFLASTSDVVDLLMVEFSTT